MTASDDQLLENTAVDYLEVSSSQEDAGFNVQVQRDRFLGGGGKSTEAATLADTRASLQASNALLWPDCTTLTTIMMRMRAPGRTPSKKMFLIAALCSAGLCGQLGVDTAATTVIATDKRARSMRHPEPQPHGLS